MVATPVSTSPDRVGRKFRLKHKSGLLVQNRKELPNPFYLLSAVAGVAFTVTACAFGLMILRTNRGLYSPEADPSEQPLMNLLDQHGLAILGAEVALLAAVTIAAIALDHVRGKRQLRDAAKETTANHE
jgi:hypothetical protein